MRPLRVLAFAAVLALTLAGCSDGQGDDHPGETPGESRTLPALHGYVFDPALRPLEGATVKVLDADVAATTDREGFFGFDGLPVDRFLVIVASLEGFTPTSKQITLAVDTQVRLNFTLEPVPVETPYSQVVKQEMLVECQLGIVAAEDGNQMKCGTGLQEIDQFDIAVDVNLAGAVVEIFWEPGTVLSESMGAKLETLDLGQLNLVLGQVVGTSPLRITVPESTAARYYPQGGLMRLTVYAEPNADENEAGVGVSVLIEQAVTAYASLFYVAPPSPTYTIADQ